MTDNEVDQILGGILRRWITADDPSYFCWSDNDLTLDGGLTITPDEYEALSQIGTGQEWWDHAATVLRGGATP